MEKLEALITKDGTNYIRLSSKDLGHEITTKLQLLLEQKETFPPTPPYKEKGNKGIKGEKKGTPLTPQGGKEKDLFGEAIVPNPPRSKRPAPPYAEIYAIAKTYYPNFNFRTTTEKRNRKIRKLWKANGQSIYVFEELFKMAHASDFLNSRNGHTFRGRLDITWIIQKAEEILEGKYSNQAMSWALNKIEKTEAIVVGEGRKMIDATKYKQIGTDETTGLPKYIRPMEDAQ